MIFFRACLSILEFCLPDMHRKANNENTNKILPTKCSYQIITKIIAQQQKTAKVCIIIYIF